MQGRSLKTKHSIYYYDPWLVLAVIALLALGLLLLASASMGVSGKFYHHPFHFFLRQVIYLIAGGGVIWLVKKIPLTFWLKQRGTLLLMSIIALITVLIPGIGRNVNGSTRWISLGVISLQVSEFAKFAIVIYLAGYLLRQIDAVRTNFIGFIKPLFLVGTIGVLLLLEPDFGALVVMVSTMLGMMYLAGARLNQFIMLLLGVGMALASIAILSPYRMARLTAFLNPWSRPFDSGYQLIQSLIAFGRGGFWGVGLGNSIQKLFYLPEAHTDFLFAILAEELGIFGQLIVLGLFILLVARAFYLGSLAAQIRNLFAAYLSYGIGLIIGIQAMINIGVNMGLLPTKGLTLPLMSYGGSSMLFNCAIIAILFRIYHEVMLQSASVPKNYFLNMKVKKSH